MKSYGRLDWSRTAAVARALVAITPGQLGETIEYELGYGGRDPAKHHPGTRQGKPDGSEVQACDCSAFVAWCLGYDRFQLVDGEGTWLNTDGILDAAVDAEVIPDLVDFRFVRKDEEVLPGDVMVYGSTYKNRRRTPGHTGIVVDVGEKFVRGAKDWWKHVSVSHCTPRPHPITRYRPHSIRVNTAALWAKRGYFVRYTGFE